MRKGCGVLGDVERAQICFKLVSKVVSLVCVSVSVAASRCRALLMGRSTPDAELHAFGQHSSASAKSLDGASSQHLQRKCKHTPRATSM